ncbi:probable dolichyl pyrophosphate Man9GlcNAc2 alpha-1,3-glucosyltransferase [Sabethes cyaneus]|uniref:probable dolichyl pyrophosphate Man9GlcNAc2 alpha-1,3-glucosyltransferase n=1 Tax=Sabethes cyaneus TaxID=53552 RepID=UPI00237DFEAE|nr:probable dolichyl pyrophosphate Man9GlcNAc2 alpha-1,3-glucosyltransferase [Sabethes cyaneus]
MAISSVSLITLVATGILLRAVISLHSYSGESKPPMYGDFEAQRHWQEVTVNLPVRQWYENSTDNDLLYWGLDYPPLTAYHSFLLGKWAMAQDPSFVRLHESRGITTGVHKNFMRNTVLLVDGLLYIPALVLACYVVRRKIFGGETTGSDLLGMAVALLYPGQILIDNGHFQYNNVSLGLAALAIAALLADRNLLGSALFVAALNYKQMELYHALPFFFYLLGWCFQHSKGFDFKKGVLNLTVLGTVVLLTFAAIWSPWLGSIDSTVQVIHRVFPIARGVFEDKVANIWCIVNVFIKLKNFENARMALICLCCTLCAVLPSSLALLFRPSKRNFLLALVNSSLGFFLLSFQVHEKSILLVSLPVMLLFQLCPLQCFWFLQVATFSMVPLLHKDSLLSAYVALTILSFGVLKVSLFALNNFQSSKKSFLLDCFNLNSLLQNRPGKKSLVNTALLHGFYTFTVGQVILLICFVYVQPPRHLPFLWPLLISAYSCAHFVLFFIYYNYLQFVTNDNSNVTSHKKSDKRKRK